MTVDPGLAPRETTPDPKPQARIVDPNAGTEKVAAEGCCRVCGASFPLNRAHLFARGQGGDDVDANIAVLCGSGSSGCHGVLTSRCPGVSGDGVKRTFEQVSDLFRQSLRADELAYVRRKKGAGWQDWLNAAYPRAS